MTAHPPIPTPGQPPCRTPIVAGDPVHAHLQVIGFGPGASGFRSPPTGWACSTG